MGMTTFAALAAHRTMAFAVSAGLRNQAAGKTIQPPHHSMMKTAKWTRTILFVAGQLKRIAGDCKCPAYCKSRMASKISPGRHFFSPDLINKGSEQ
jgi:hypothetical protein